MDRVTILKREATMTPAERCLRDLFPRRAKALQPRGASTLPVQGATPDNAFQSLLLQEPETTAAARTVDVTMADGGSSSSNTPKRSKKTKNEGKKSTSKGQHRQETKKEPRKKRQKKSEETETCKTECALDNEKRPEVAGTAEAPPARKPRLRSPQQGPSTARAEQPALLAPQGQSYKRPLQKLLCHLLNDLRKMDQHELFAWPVSDVVSPGYSALIHSPMDFSTMKKRIDDNHYSCISEFREDLKLMCDNAMTYHRSGTVYFNSAKHMWNYGNKLLSKDQLLAWESSLPFFGELTSEELGFVFKAAKPVDSKPRLAIAKDPMCAKASPPCLARKGRRVQRQEKKPGLKSPNKIRVKGPKAGRAAPGKSPRVKGQKAGHVAPGRLTAKPANSKFGFLRQTEDGSTSLSILTHTHCDDVRGPGETRANLETLVGKLAHGTGTLINVKDRIKDIARPVDYLDHGPYSTYAPHYDSALANLSKQESDLVYLTYGDEPREQRAETLPSFAKDWDTIPDMVCSLFDEPATGEQQTKTVEAFRTRCEGKNLGLLLNPGAQARNLEQPNAKHNDSKPSGSSSASKGLATGSAVAGSKRTSQPAARKDFTKYRRVREDHYNYCEHHITVHSSLDSTGNVTSAMLQQKLQESSEMIDRLSRMQQERLSRVPPAHLSQIQGPSGQELELAEKVAKRLSELVSFATPGDVVSVEAVRKALGISYAPTV